MFFRTFVPNAAESRTQLLTWHFFQTFRKFFVLKQSLDHKAVHWGVLVELFAHPYATGRSGGRIQHHGGSLRIGHPGFHRRHEHRRRRRGGGNRFNTPGAGALREQATRITRTTDKKRTRKGRRTTSYPTPCRRTVPLRKLSANENRRHRASCSGTSFG